MPEILWSSVLGMERAPRGNRGAPALRCHLNQQHSTLPFSSALSLPPLLLLASSPSRSSLQPQGLPSTLLRRSFPTQKPPEVPRCQLLGLAREACIGGLPLACFLIPFILDILRP